MSVGLAIALILVAGVLGVVAARLLAPKPPERTPLPEEDRNRLVEAARTEAEQVKRAAELEAKDITLRAQQKSGDELKVKRAEIERQRLEMARSESAIAQRGSEIDRREEDVAKKERGAAGREQAAEATAKRAEEALAEAKARIEKLAGLTAEQAREKLQAEVIDSARKAAAGDVKRIEDEARIEAEGRAKAIIGTAIQKYAGEYVAEKTVSVVPLPSDDLKGRIIGREGRNIRAFEAATGIDLIIDDTPEAVIISCFNPVRREVAKMALTRLISDGRFHPTRIEEIVAKCESEIQQVLKEAGDQAIFNLGLAKVHPELVRLLGRLKFRSSYAQNLLQHSIEVGFLSGVMAAELGVNVKLARRAGLFHDLGKAVDHEIEGSHAQVGAQIAKKFGESPKVAQAIASHHGDEPPQSLLDHIVDACNVLSAQRPGARRETMQTYIQRLDDLEKLCTSYEGVEKAYAIQMGKEVRIMVEAARVPDEQASVLAREIAKRIEDSLTYPGQIRVSVIRETRATDYAK
ncbi:MAG: ribonuclease Y [Myxococcales bacterium]|nr:ribonuclease Y [Myxococcales bacterium]